MKKNLVKKRIAFFHELDKGGARRSSNEFSKHLLKYFYVDLFIVDDTRNKTEDDYYTKVNFYKFIPRIWKGNDWKTRLYKDTIELFRIFALHAKVAKKINNGDYDAVFVLPSKYTQAPYILRMIKKPTIYYCQEPLRMVYEPLFKVGREVGLGRYYYEKFNRLHRKIVDRINIRRASTILTNSNYTGRNVKKIYGLKSKTVYMGVDTAFFNPGTNIKKIFDILYIGAYDKSENYPFLKEALIKMKYPENKVRLLFKEKEWISRNTDMRDLYRSAKVVVCIGYKEPFGLMPIEAMACGLPVVALDDGGYKETVRNGVNGYLVTKKSELLIEALKKALNSTNYKKLSIQACQIANSEWSWKHSTKRLLKVINESINV